jgi:hypothetical protein
VTDRLHHVLSSTFVRYAFGAGLVFLILVGTGREVVNGHTKLILELILAGAFCGLAAAQRGACVGLLVLAAMNGLPFIDNSRSVTHHIALQDVACLALIATAFAWTLTGRRDQAPTPLARALSWCGLALLVWSGFIVGRTWAEGHAPLLGAIRFGRDFLYFGALLIVLPRVRFRERDVKVLVGVLGVGVCLYAAGQIVTVEGLASPTWLVHAAASATTLGVTRLYAQMTDLVSAGVAFAIAAVALTRGRAQWRTIPIAALLTGSLILQLTRARWIATIAGVVVVSLWLALQSDRPIAVILRRRLTVFIVALATCVVVVLTVAPGLISAGPLVQRVVSIFSPLGSPTTSTLAVRQQVAAEMTSLLGGHWLTGLGLIPPSVHYYPQFPSGSIRDPDLGVLNAVMPMGIIGAGLIYLPLIVALVHCMRQARLKAGLAWAWLNYGGQIWIVGAVASSITLVSLFSPSGLVLSATILAVLSQPGVTGSGLPAALPIETERSPALPRAVAA